MYTRLTSDGWTLIAFLAKGVVVVTMGVGVYCSIRALWQIDWSGSHSIAPSLPVADRPHLIAAQPVLPAPNYAAPKTDAFTQFGQADANHAPSGTAWDAPMPVHAPEPAVVRQYYERYPLYDRHPIIEDSPPRRVIRIYTELPPPSDRHVPDRSTHTVPTHTLPTHTVGTSAREAPPAPQPSTPRDTKRRETPRASPKPSTPAPSSDAAKSSGRGSRDSGAQK